MFRLDIFKALIRRVCFFSRPDPLGQIMVTRQQTCITGQGHNTTTASIGAVVGAVVGYCLAKSRPWPNPQHHNSKMPHTYVRVRSRARICEQTLLFCCSVVEDIYLIEKKEKKGKFAHNSTHNSPECAVVALPHALVKVLKSLNKRGF